MFMPALNQKGSSTTVPLSVSPAIAPAGTKYGSSVGPRTIPGIYTVTSVEFCAGARLPVFRNSLVISWRADHHFHCLVVVTEWFRIIHWHVDLSAMES
jgi:hypothetical protein